MNILKGVKDEIVIRATARIRQDEGRHIDVPFKLRCKRPSSAEVKEIMEESRAGTIDDEATIRAYVLNWDMPGADGNSVEFSEENLALALDHPDYRQAMMNALIELFFGKEALRAKNSLTSAAPGQARR